MLIQFSKRTYTAPQHLHVKVCCYERWIETDTATGPMGKHCDVTVICNDEQWAIAEAKRLSGLDNAHAQVIEQCPDPEHLKGLDLPNVAHSG